MSLAVAHGFVLGGSGGLRGPHAVVARVVFDLDEAERLEDRRHAHAEAAAVSLRRPYQPYGFVGHPHASIVPSAASFCSWR